MCFVVLLVRFDAHDEHRCGADGTIRAAEWCERWLSVNVHYVRLWCEEKRDNLPSPYTSGPNSVPNKPSACLKQRWSAGGPNP